VKRSVFEAMHCGRKQVKTVDQLASDTGEGRQQVLNAATQLANQDIIHRERNGRSIAYRRDPFYQANCRKILRYVDNPGSIASLPTKRRPRSPAGTTVISVPVRRSRIRAKCITVDEIQSFARVRRVCGGQVVTLRESEVKEGLLRVIGDKGRFQDWGGEQNDFLTDKLQIRGRRRVAAFALKGPGKQGILTPAGMGKNGDQIQRLARSPAEVLIVQYHGQVADSVREQLELFAQLKSVWEDRQIWYGVIAGEDSSRIVAAYPKAFARRLSRRGARRQSARAR